MPGHWQRSKLAACPEGVNVARHRYRRMPGTPVLAIQLKLDMPGFRYVKWGHEQR